MSDEKQPSSRQSNPQVDDVHRTGDDLLARIDELTSKCGDIANGWRPLLFACGREIGILRNQLIGIASSIESIERKRRNSD